MDRFGTASAEVQWSIRSGRGRLIVERHPYGDPAVIGGRQGRTRTRWGVSSTERWFQAPVSGGGFVPGSTRSYTAPIWPLTLASAVLPVIAARAMLLRRRERVRRQRGLGPSCNYDVRATPNRCPERGTETRPTVTAWDRTVRL